MPQDETSKDIIKDSLMSESSIPASLQLVAKFE